LIAEVPHIVTFVLKKKLIGLTEKQNLKDYFSVNEEIKVIPIEITEEIFNA
jgi:hypothetical protein